MKSILTELVFYGSKNLCARTDNVLFPISEICNSRVSLSKKWIRQVVGGISDNVDRVFLCEKFRHLLMFFLAFLM